MNNLTLLNMAHQKMNWLSERQAVLSQNIANADSPGYRSQDLRPLEFRGMVEQVTRIPVARTAGSHLGGTLQQSDYRIEAQRGSDIYEANPNGNGVVLEEQMIAVQDTRLQYDLAVNLYNKQVSMFRVALGAGSR